VTFTDIAAVVGALAWIPPIFVGVRAWLTKPSIQVITQPRPEVGYTTLGPILNLRVALTVIHKDVVITGVRLVVTHESGNQTVFSWRGVVQRMGTMTYPEMGAVPFERELNVLAMKVAQKDVEERFIRFQNLDYLDKKEGLENTTLKDLAYLKKTGSFESERFLASQGMADLYSFVRQSFAWKPGSYRLRIELQSPDAFAVKDDEYSFSLTPLQVQNLSENLRFVETYYANEVDPPQQEDGKPAQIPWSWVYPDMQRLNG
jgi:hypothetical protein